LRHWLNIGPLEASFSQNLRRPTPALEKLRLKLKTALVGRAWSHHPVEIALFAWMLHHTGHDALAVLFENSLGTRVPPLAKKKK